MRKDTIGLIACLALLLSVASAEAGIKSCNATLVSQNVCDNTTQDHLYINIAGESRQDVVTALAKRVGWTANIACSQIRVDAGTCTVGQLGQSIPNPETKAKAASRYLRELTKQAVRDEKIVAAAAAEAAAQTPVEVTD